MDVCQICRFVQPLFAKQKLEPSPELSVNEMAEFTKSLRTFPEEPGAEVKCVKVQSEPSLQNPLDEAHSNFLISWSTFEKKLARQCSVRF